MVDNSLKFYDMEKQISLIPSKHIDENLEIIVSDIKAKRKYIKKVNFLKKGFSKIGFKLYNKEVGDYDKKFSIEAHCNGCGICAKVCPVNNIEMKSAPTFTGNCIRCYACTQNCPQNAIRFKGEKSKVRFRNENVSLKEIIEANNYNS
jgi:ferredoxin